MSPVAGRWRLALAVIAAGAAAVGGCGSEPAIPASTAQRLAAHSDQVAERLEAGEPCQAAAATRELASDFRRATRDGAIPTQLQPRIEREIAGLQASIACEQLPPPPAAATDPSGASSGPGDQDGAAGDEPTEGTGGEDEPGGGRRSAHGRGGDERREDERGGDDDEEDDGEGDD